MKRQLHIKLISEATFGRGDGLPGFVDQEIEYEADTGLPFIRGRTIKGLLVEECANILFALPKAQRQTLQKTAHYLFGNPGSGLKSQAGMHIGAARLPDELRQAIQAQELIQPADVLSTLTDLRRQTAVNHTNGIPDDGSLRTMRVLKRGLQLSAAITFDKTLGDDDPELALLSACVAAWRRGGTGRNRGRGRLNAWLDSEDKQKAYLNAFIQVVGEVAA